MDNRPIGVFDSGLGGLTGVRALRKRLPLSLIHISHLSVRTPHCSRMNDSQKRFNYLTSTLAPASVSFFWMSSASALSLIHI